MPGQYKSSSGCSAKFQQHIKLILIRTWGHVGDVAKDTEVADLTNLQCVMVCIMSLRPSQKLEGVSQGRPASERGHDSLLTWTSGLMACRKESITRPVTADLEHH